MPGCSDAERTGMPDGGSHGGPAPGPEDVLEGARGNATPRR